MKKDKAHKKPAGDFNNSPFRTLKRFTPKPVPATNTPSARAAAPARVSGEEDETALFLRAAAGARRIGRDASPSPDRDERRTGKNPGAGELQEDSRLFLDAMEKMGTGIREKAPAQDDEESARRSSAGRMRQLKRGTLRISGELDLHGQFREAALAKLERFIAAAHGSGQKAVLVITGKGINSPEGPVLQGAVAAWLRREGRHMVAEFAAAPRELGGSGAFVVFLRSS